MLVYQIVQDCQEWNRILLTLPSAHVLQSWDWGDFKSRWGWTAERLVWLENGQPAAAAQVLQRSIPGTPWTFLYVTRGPALDYANLPLVDLVLADLEAYGRRQHALFVKVDPDVPRQYGEADNLPDPTGQGVLALLTRRGWRFSPEQIQFRNTVLVDLRPEPGELLAAMKNKWRYNIRLAERKGVTVRSGTGQDISLFYEMYAETANRDNFLIRPEAYYRDVWQRFLAVGQAQMLLAFAGETPVAGLFLFLFGRTAWYLYGASTAQARPLMPNHLLQWKAMEWARSAGCTCYDMWGAPDVFDPADRMWGVYQFKKGFGGRVMLGLGAFDYPVNRSGYWAFTAALPRLRSFLRRRR